MHSSNSSKSSTGTPAPNGNPVPLAVMAPNIIIIIIANWARAKGALFISREQQETVIIKYCQVAALNN